LINTNLKESHMRNTSRSGVLSAVTALAVVPGCAAGAHDARAAEPAMLTATLAGATGSSASAIYVNSGQATKAWRFPIVFVRTMCSILVQSSAPCTSGTTPLPAATRIYGYMQILATSPADRQCRCIE
jgi:hypothetical protein